jgi:hypothetical protein
VWLAAADGSCPARAAPLGSDATIQRRIAAEFDPHGIFDSARLLGTPEA